MKKFKNINKKPLIFLYILMALSILGGTFAVFQATMTKTNTFNAAEYNIKLDEDFNPSTWPGLTTKKVYIRNEGSAPVIIRVSYNETWKDSNGFIFNNLVNGNNVVTKNWTSDWTSNFTQGSDGWYYYKKILDGNSSVQILESIILNASATDEYKAANYELSFNYEAVQATSEAVKELWGLNASINGSNVTWAF